MSTFRLFYPECVFVHIPKTGGTSIRRGVWNNKYQGPVFGEIPIAWKNLFSFAFVRHPLDRLISAWDMHRMNNAITIEEYADIVFDERVPFGPTRRNEEERIRHHTFPQTHPFNCLDQVEFVGRYETLEEDFEFVAKKLGVKRSLPHLYAATRKSRWQDALDEDLLQRCVDYYCDDFKQLDYEPPKMPTSRATWAPLTNTHCPVR